MLFCKIAIILFSLLIFLGVGSNRSSEQGRGLKLERK